MNPTALPPAKRALQKVPTGIKGFDGLCDGGLTRGRVTLVSAEAGCGKTLFGMEFVVHGAQDRGEPGLFVSFDESAEELTQNAAGFGFDLDDLIARKLLSLDVVRLGTASVTEAESYDLDGLLSRLERSIGATGAKRIVLDSVECLFDLLPNPRALRAEFSRLLRWLKNQGLTVVITSERGGSTLSRHGLAEYVADCVVLLDQRVHDQITTRRLRISKYRGSRHVKDEVPFTIDERGFNVAPVSSVGLDHEVLDERISSGIPRLDKMLGGKGLYRGSTVLLSGVAGSGKTSIAAHAILAACKRGERCLYVAFEEASRQIVRNMRSIGVDLAPWVDAGLLRFHAARATECGLERHLAAIEREIETTAARVVVLDPVSGLDRVGTPLEVELMLMRLIDSMKRRGVTAILTSLTRGRVATESTDVGLSSLIDTWLLVQFVEGSGERNRALYVLKSRGMPHSNQVREFVMSERGIDLVDVYAGPSGVLTGSARHAQAARERDDSAARRHEIDRRERELAAKQKILKARLGALQAELEAAQDEARMVLSEDREREAAQEQERQQIAELRHADSDAPHGDQPAG
jgi:circadian clock protein KaiC